MEGMTYYERLGVEEDAGREEITAAFKKLRKEFHPDSRPQAWRAHFDELMKDVNEAHQTLSDPNARAKYDAKLAAQRSSAGAAEDTATNEEPPQEQPYRERQQHHEPGDDDQHRQDDEDAWRRWEGRQQPQDDHDYYDEEESAGEEEDAWQSWESESRQDTHQQEDTWEEDAWDGYDDQHVPAEPTPDRTLYRLPNYAHTSAIVLVGAWAWAGATLVLLATGLIVFQLAGLAVAAGAPLLAWRANGGAGLYRVAGLLRRVAGGVPLMDRNAEWFAQALLRSFYLGPLLMVGMVVVPGAAGSLLAYLVLFGALAAAAYVGLWIAEAIRARREAGPRVR